MKIKLDGIKLKNYRVKRLVYETWEYRNMPGLPSWGLRVWTPINFNDFKDNVEISLIWTMRAEKVIGKFYILL